MSDISELRQQMKITQEQVRSLYKKGFSAEEISEKLDIPLRKIKVIIRWKCKRDRRTERKH